jgi:hypothetical protein
VPELPDVEGFRRELARSLPGRRVRRVDVRDAGRSQHDGTSMSPSVGLMLARRTPAAWQKSTLGRGAAASGIDGDARNRVTVDDVAPI